MGNNPVNYVDPTGHIPVAIPLLIGGADVLAKAIAALIAIGATALAAEKISQEVKDAQRQKEEQKPVPIVPNYPVEEDDDDEERRILYHYTSEENYHKILGSQQLWPANSLTDAYYGPGVYMTDHAPHQFATRDVLALSLWSSNRPEYMAKTTHYIAIDVTGILELPITTPFTLRPAVPSPTNFIWIYGNGTVPLNLTGRIIGGGATGLKTQRELMRETLEE